MQASKYCLQALSRWTGMYLQFLEAGLSSFKTHSNLTHIKIGEKLGLSSFQLPN